METSPSSAAPAAFPTCNAQTGMGAASIRGSVPSCRSSRMPVTPNCTVKNTKNAAIPAAR